MNKNVSAAIRTLRDNLVQFVNSKSFSVTKELYTEINGIISALDSLKLDYLFLSNSVAWRKQFDQNVLNQDQTAILDLMQDGEVLIKELVLNLEKNSFSNFQENQAKAVHFIAKEKLRHYLKCIHPYSHGAYSRLKNYTMNLGLVDRYSSIKNELVSNDPKDGLPTWIKWTDKTFPEPIRFKTPDWRDSAFGMRHDDEEVRRYTNKSSLTNKNEAGYCFPDTNRFNFSNSRIESRLSETKISESVTNEIKTYPKEIVLNENRSNQNKSTLSRSHTMRNRTEQSNYFNRADSIASTYATFETMNTNNTWQKPVQEAGINLNFPGQSEHQYRFSKPNKPNYKNFVLNPQQNIKPLNRPFGAAAICEPITTEYRQRYAYPDSNKIDKFPWIKQC